MLLFEKFSFVLFSGNGYAYFETTCCNVLLGFTSFWAPIIRATFGTMVGADNESNL